MSRSDDAKVAKLPAKKPADRPRIVSLADLFAVAYQIEIDAVERYKVLADQMETHNNGELVAVFRDLARAEGIHAEEIRHQAGDIDVVAHARKVATWGKGESPEEVDLGEAHYLMTPWHALQMALGGEKRALAYYTQLVETAQDEKIREMAKEYVEEEAEHVNLCYRLLRKYPAPEGETWADDPDPPVSQE
jgi:rubrerythrin